MTTAEGDQRNRAVRGRGAASNPRNRFEVLDVEPEEPGPDRLPTELFRDHSRSALSHNQSPDVPFETSLNPYRGCEHGCIYCYARPTHELLGFSAGLDFETKILVKEDAPELLDRELGSPRWNPRVIALSGVTDPYQPVERRLRLTRRCLEVLARYRNPVAVITKNHLVTRDADLLGDLAAHGAARVAVSITTLDSGLAAAMEPRTSHPRDRLRAITELTAAGVPCSLLIAPVIPALNDHEIPRILEAAAEAGATSAGFVMLRLPHGVGPLFESWLERCYPDRKRKILDRVRGMRDGRLNDPRFGSRMRGEGVFVDQIQRLFAVAAKRHGLDRPGPPLSTAAFRGPHHRQLSLLEPETARPPG